MVPGTPFIFSADGNEILPRPSSGLSDTRVVDGLGILAREWLKRLWGLVDEKHDGPGLGNRSQVCIKMIGVDTNVLAHYLLNGDVKQGKAALDLLICIRAPRPAPQRGCPAQFC